MYITSNMHSHNSMKLSKYVVAIMFFISKHIRFTLYRIR